MVSTKSEPGPFDGLERAAPDEPVFTLRAGDPLAAALVHKWVQARREAINGTDMPPEKRELELIQCREAEEIGWAMEDWRKGLAPAELPKEQSRPTYSGNGMGAEELAAKKRHDGRKMACATINNAVAELSETAASLVDLSFPIQSERVDRAVAILKAASEDVRPKRASYAHLSEGL